MTPAVVNLAILSPAYSVNHSDKSGPVMMTFGALLGVGTVYWLVTTPAVVMRATLLLVHSVYQIAPSGPAPRSQGARGTGYSVSFPAVVMLPIFKLPPCSVNQSAPPGPLTMSQGSRPGVGSGNSVMAPLVVMRPILFPRVSVNQRAPSGPGVTEKGRLDLVGMSYSAIDCAGAWAGRVNSNAASHASGGIQGCLGGDGCIGLIEVSTIYRLLTENPDLPVSAGICRPPRFPHARRCASGAGSTRPSCAVCSPSLTCLRRPSIAQSVILIAES